MREIPRIGPSRSIDVLGICESIFSRLPQHERLFFGSEYILLSGWLSKALAPTDQARRELYLEVFQNEDLEKGFPEGKLKTLLFEAARVRNEDREREERRDRDPRVRARMDRIRGIVRRPRNRISKGQYRLL